MSRLRDHYGLEEFLERIAVAYDGPDLTDNDIDFLADIKSKFDRWGDDMFFSEEQASYLDSLSAKGGYNCEVFESDEFQIIHMVKRRNLA